MAILKQDGKYETKYMDCNNYNLNYLDNFFNKIIMKNLISNTEFGKLLLTKHLSDKQVRDIRDNFDSFLSQSLELWMFVPCDEDGNVLEEPDSIGVGNYFYYEKALDQYQQAKERCLFEGLQFDYETATVYYGIGLVIYMLGASKTIEDLVKYNLELTPTAQKQIGL